MEKNHTTSKLPDLIFIMQNSCYSTALIKTLATFDIPYFFANFFVVIHI